VGRQRTVRHPDDGLLGHPPPSSPVGSRGSSDRGPRSSTLVRYRGHGPSPTRRSAHSRCPSRPASARAPLSSTSATR
jgi:hypothetical protein